MSNISIIGKVIDFDTNEELIGANIKISKNGENFGGFSTNIEGNFGGVKELEVGVYTFEFSYVGYDSKSFERQITPTTQEINFGEVKLVEISEQLNEVIVEAKRFTGKIVDKSTKEPISEATILSNTEQGEKSTSQSNGDFAIVIELDETYIVVEPDNTITTETQTQYKNFTLNISAGGYSSTSVNTTNQDGNLKQSLGIIELEPSQPALQNQKREELLLKDEQIQAIKTEKIISSPQSYATNIALNNVKARIVNTLLPAILNLIAAFGITNIKNALGKKFGDLNATCPANLDELNRLIERKNRLTRALNNIYSFLNTVRIGVDIIDKTITAAQLILPALIAASSIPAAPPSSATIIEKIDRELRKYKLISSSTLLILTIIVQLLQRVLNYLSLLDSLIQGCAIEGALPQEQLTDDLLRATQEQSQQLSPVVTNVNGFEMDVETEKTEAQLKRRRAIAKNKAGVIMLKGEWSFSSNDQILIDELVFYIKQNDLKAE